MKRIVLDKSALQGVPKGFLSGLRGDFEFLLPNILLHEILTQGLDFGALTVEEENARRQSVRACLEKAVYEAGNSWFDNDNALLWEVRNGLSAQSMQRIQLPVPIETLNLTGRILDRSRTFDGRIGRAAESVIVPQEKESRFRDISKGGPGAVYLSLESNLQMVTPFLAKTKEVILNHAKSQGIPVSPGFIPGPGWYTYGRALTCYAFAFWKLATYGNKPAQPKQPANPIFDMAYLACVSIADGILSGDKILKKIAWACFPEKRDHIYEFANEGNSTFVRRFVPQFA